MQDKEIIALYWQRDQRAIRETEDKYGRYLTTIAYHILADREDSEESVSDTYLKAWNSIPPHRPQALAAYLGKITREGAIDRYRRRTSRKRGGSEYALSLSELEECVSGDAPEQELDARLLAETINNFLRTLTPQARTMFIRRYYFADPIREIAAGGGVSVSKVKSTLHRTRIHLREYLEKEGFHP